MQSLKWSVISFTEKGAELAEKIKRFSKEQQLPCEIHTYHGRKQVENLNAWTKEQFSLRNAIIFIGACGIAVRTIAPFLKDKLTDSPVLVLDEAGNYVIPLLSGHVGGANEIALLLAELLGAVPVITTATDINNAFAIDVFAKKHDLSIDKKEGIKKVSAKVLEKKEAFYDNRSGICHKSGCGNRHTRGWTEAGAIIDLNPQRIYSWNRMQKE